MAGPTTGLTGDVVSWAGTFNAAMLALIKPAGFTLNADAAELDTTGYAAGAAAVRSRIKGLKSWNGTIEGFLATPTNGIAGSVSGASYTSNVRSWEMTMTAGALDSTSWPITSSWKTFMPGLIEWGGTFEALVDDTTAITEAAPSGEPLTATFTMSSGNTLAGSIFTNRAEVISRVAEMNVVRYSYVGTGHVTSVGTANLIPAASTLATPVAGSLVLKLSEQGATDRTLTGSAFWTQLMISVNPAAANSVRVGFQGSGALVPV